MDQVYKLRYCLILLRKSQSSLKISAATRTVFSMPKLHIFSEVQYSPKNWSHDVRELKSEYCLDDKKHCQLQHSLFPTTPFYSNCFSSSATYFVETIFCLFSDFSPAEEFQTLRHSIICSASSFIRLLQVRNERHCLPKLWNKPCFYPMS